MTCGRPCILRIAASASSAPGRCARPPHECIINLVLQLDAGTGKGFSGHRAVVVPSQSIERRAIESHLYTAGESWIPVALAWGWRRGRSATSNGLRFVDNRTENEIRVGNRVPPRLRSGRTLWCQGAPTWTCCGVTQGVKLRGQCRRFCQPQGGARLGETWKAERT